MYSTPKRSSGGHRPCDADPTHCGVFFFLIFLLTAHEAPPPLIKLPHGNIATAFEQRLEALSHLCAYLA